MIIKCVETSKVSHVLKDWLLQSTSLSENASEKKINIEFKYNNWNEVAYVCFSVQ